MRPGALPRPRPSQGLLSSNSHLALTGRRGRKVASSLKYSSKGTAPPRKGFASWSSPAKPPVVSVMSGGRRLEHTTAQSVAGRLRSGVSSLDRRRCGFRVSRLGSGKWFFSGPRLDRDRGSLEGRAQRSLGLYASHVRVRPRFFFSHRPEIGRGYPLNLSISLSGGKETNQDSPSNGE